MAILMVVLHHYLLPSLSAPLDRAWAFVAYPGWAGVDLFFVLSGFLITGILVDARAAGTPRVIFYARRMLRIFPLYYVVLVLVLAVAPGAHGLIGGAEMLRSAPWYSWLYLMNWQIAAENAFPDTGLGVAWTLAIEEQFYLLWPLVVFAVAPRRLAAVAAAMVVLAIAWRAAVLVHGGTPIQASVTTPARIDSLAIGAWLSLMVRQPTRWQAVSRRAPLVLIGAAGILLGLGISDGGLFPDRPFMSVFGYTLLAAAFGALLILILRAAPGSVLQRLFSSRTLTTLGKYSYAIYLFHRIWQEVLDHSVFAGAPFAVAGSMLPWQVAYYIAGLGGSLLLAVVSWRILERRVLTLKDRLPYAIPERAPHVSFQNSAIV